MAKDDCNLRIHALPARDGLQILNWTQKRADTHMNASTLEFRQDENKWKMRIASNFFSQCFPPIDVGRLTGKFNQWEYFIDSDEHVWAVAT